MESLIQIEQTETGTLALSSETIAANTDVQYKNIIELIRSNISDFEAFGGVAFETPPFETAGGEPSPGPSPTSPSPRPLCSSHSCATARSSNTSRSPWPARSTRWPSS